MAKLTSPARIPGRKNDFCSSLPKRMIVGPTVLRVTNGNGAPARPHRRRRAPDSDLRLMPALPSDYDSDPDRWHSCDRNLQVFGDIHAPVARRIVGEDLAPVLDIGGGQGYLESLLPTGWLSIVVDLSPTQLADAPHPKIRADALHLPVRDRCAGAVTALWMLYHLADPACAVAEAARGLRPGGLFVASTASRSNEPGLASAYRRTPSDAAGAPAHGPAVSGGVRGV